MDVSTWSTVFTHWPTDWIIIGAFAVFAALDAMRSGSARVAALVLSLPAALLLLQQLPKALFVGPLSAQFSTPPAQLAILGALIALMFIAAYRLLSSFSNGTGPIQALVSGLAGAVVLLVVWLQIPGLDSVWNFGPQVHAVFGEAYRFWWLICSYAALAAVRR